MPLVRISTRADKLSPVKKKKLCQDILKVMLKHTTAPPEAVSVIIDEVPDENWMMNSNMISESDPFS